MNFLKKLFNTKTTIITTLTVTSSNGFHLRPIAKFVTEAKKFDATIILKANGKEVLATQVPKILSLSLEKGDIFELKCKGKEAKEATKQLSKLFNELMQSDKEIENIEQENEEYEAQSIKGITISKGIGIGVPISYYKEKTYKKDALSLKEALKRTAKDLEELYKNNQEKDEAEIFLAQKSLLESEVFQKDFKNIDKEIENLKGGKFQSRIADYRDLKQRIESYMGVNNEFIPPNGDEDSYIVVVDEKEELLPSEVEALTKLNIVGVILQKGSTTSHVAILLRSFNIPSIISSEQITTTGEYFYSILDANSGQLILVPTEEDFKKARKKAQKNKEKEAKSYKKRFKTTKTKDGKSVKVLANITDLNSAKEAKELGADGVGLLRTEFLFTKAKPSIEEQTQTYKSIFELFDEVTVRTLDIGGDKSLPYIEIPKEDNPFLGLRGIRFSLQEQTLFKEQLLAIFKAVGSISSNEKTIKIMFPMISTTQEFTEAKNIAKTVAKANNINLTNIQFGIMLEVPSVIFGLKEFNKLVDFYSIGSNDLTQYLFAIERTHPTLTVDPLSPLLLLALEQIRKGVEKPISICGELAGLEVATQKLLSMNYTTLSVSAKLIPNLKESIRNV